MDRETAESCGIAAFERDIALVRGHIEACPDSVADPKKARHGLALFLKAVRSGCVAILKTRARHMCTRPVIYARNSSNFIRTIVSYSEKHATGPGLAGRQLARVYHCVR